MGKGTNTAVILLDVEPRDGRSPRFLAHDDALQLNRRRARNEDALEDGLLRIIRIALRHRGAEAGEVHGRGGVSRVVCLLAMTRPGPSSCRVGHLAGVFFVTPRRILVRAATRITRLRGRPWGRHSGKTPRSGGAAGP